MNQAVLNLDANASYGLLPEVRELLRTLTDSELLNPSSIHRGGQFARGLIERAREQVAGLLGLRAGERLIFTSGATEANNTAIEAARYAAADRKMAAPRIVISAVEHPSLREPVLRLARCGFEVLEIPPRADGVFFPQDFALAARGAVLLSCMLANNETGAILPVAEIVRSARAISAQTIMHSDLVQAVGKIDFTFGTLGLDLGSISAHKIGGLSGVGALVVGADFTLIPDIIGGPQELRMRAGTENVLGIAAFGAAAEAARREREERVRIMHERRATFVETIVQGVEDLRINFAGLERAPHTVSVTVPGIRADDLVVALDLNGVYLSAGAACSSGKPEPSHVLMAMGFAEREARETVRVSIPHTTTDDQIRRAAATFARTVAQIRGVG